MQFRSVAEAEKVLKEGLSVKGFILPDWALENEIYTKIRQCMKCYKYDHYSSSCSEPLKVCSTCGNTGHRYNQCTVKNPSQYKCCICKGNHKAVSGACNDRKKAIREEKQRLKAPKPTSRANTSVREGSSSEQTPQVHGSRQTSTSAGANESHSNAPSGNTGTAPNPPQANEFPSLTEGGAGGRPQTAINSLSTFIQLAPNADAMMFALISPFIRGCKTLEGYREIVYDVLKQNNLGHLKLGNVGDDLLQERLTRVAKMGIPSFLTEDFVSLITQGQPKSQKKRKKLTKAQRRARRNQTSSPPTQEGSNEAQNTTNPATKGTNETSNPTREESNEIRVETQTENTQAANSADEIGESNTSAPGQNTPQQGNELSQDIPTRQETREAKGTTDMPNEKPKEADPEEEKSDQRHDTVDSLLVSNLEVSELVNLTLPRDSSTPANLRTRSARKELTRSRGGQIKRVTCKVKGKDVKQSRFMPNEYKPHPSLKKVMLRAPDSKTFLALADDYKHATLQKAIEQKEVTLQSISHKDKKFTHKEVLDLIQANKIDLSVNSYI